MEYKIQWQTHGEQSWADLKVDFDKPLIFDDMDEAVLRAAKQASNFHSYKYRVVQCSDPEVIVTLQGGIREST